MWLHLYRKFSLDDLLTNVMIYWTTGSIVSSMRFYKENMRRDLGNSVDAKYVAKWCHYQDHNFYFYLYRTIIILFHN